MSSKKIITGLTGLLISLSAMSQCPTINSTNAVNDNGSMSNGTLTTTDPSDYNTTQFIWPFLRQYCYTGIADANGPVIPNWFTSSGTPDGNHVAKYVGGQTTENGPTDVYETFYTTASLKANTTYDITFKVAVKNKAGKLASTIEVVNRLNNNGFLINQCSGNALQLPVNGTVILSKTVAANTSINAAPNFETVCGTFTTGNTANSAAIIWFRMGLDGITADGSNTDYLSNYVYIKDFFITPSPTTAITEEVKNKQIKLYPNPFNESLKIFVKSVGTIDSRATIQLTNIEGIIKYTGTITVNEENEIKINLPAGIYFAKIQYNNSEVFEQKLIKVE
jgi:hypothetical protein